ncbi:helix-turn-helix domain-containing protein [Mesorhizobium sp. M4B.F.Ca.ET.143.01.1.1]|uniref:helix-turn-helix domain-containing protein n=1 Tax=Mesorhizobium sp. M4B.F.Ca.ET.143.01.1.1 TaxID=2563947 RepID=UPI001093DA7C|nr:helix-turn-helix domain-containing protein [Mesorhizobium sp. M4B.F.Ca.ET.143.01.1.1]TGV26346.1 hypothetical protein EN786_12555 [Mesorhizobium sp. M4B.F.Ca.ET.143.01.1.1]
MHIFSYRNTERGIYLRGSAKREERRRLRLAEQRATWEAEQAAKERRRLEVLQRQERINAIQEELREAGVKPNGRIFRQIEDRAMKLFGVTKIEILSPRRDQRIAFVRSFICYWACRRTTFSLPDIGRLLNRDHTSILAAKRRYPERRAKMGRVLREVR